MPRVRRGTAGEHEPGSGVAAMAPSLPEGEAHPRRPLASWQELGGLAAAGSGDSNSTAWRSRAAGVPAVGSWYHTAQAANKASIMSAEEASLFSVP
jgi:hypothetical protein